MSQYAIRRHACHTVAGALRQTKAEPESLEVIIKSGMLSESQTPDKRQKKKGPHENPHLPSEPDITPMVTTCPKTPYAKGKDTL